MIDGSFALALLAFAGILIICGGIKYIVNKYILKEDKKEEDDKIGSYDNDIWI